MSEWNSVHIKQRIEVAIRSVKQTYTFGSIIVRKNDNEVFFRMPSSPHSTEVIRKGQPAEVTIHTDKKVIKFNTEIGSVQPGNPATVQIPRPQDAALDMESKGGFYELSVEVPLQYRIMRDPVTPISEFKKGTTKSLSADECTINATKSIAAGSFVEVALSLPDEPEVSFVGKVSRSGQVPNQKPPVFTAEIKYEVIRRGEQDKIMKFVFDRQRSLRKRGMF